MSVGNVTQAVDLERDNLTLVLGNNLDLGGDGSRNGTGKTTLINALSFGIYGNALTNNRKDNLINKTNAKNMLVTIDFEYNGSQYRIERGRRPNVFRFIRDGIDLNDGADDVAQGEMRQTQVEVDSIIGISHAMFKHIVALNTYTDPFLSMRANDQRELIEELLGITELSRKAEALKEVIKETKDEIKEEEYNLKSIEDANSRILKNITDIERRQRIWQDKHDKELKELEDALNSLSHVDIKQEIANHQTLNEYTEKKSKLEEAQRWVDSISADNKKFQDLETRVISDIEKIKDHKCFAWGQEVHDSKQEEILREKEELLGETKSHLMENYEKLDAHTKVIEDVSRDLP